MRVLQVLDRIQGRIDSIRRVMLFFGPVSSVFDFLTFAVVIEIFHTGAEPFGAGAVTQVSRHACSRRDRFPVEEG
ncbi:hypothetical protein [Streptomyces sp. NPDC001068]|uniref:hypothetical protein n=1 Tax=Streptomyces sp. NPDC001068 TaxID=3364544 RepID=UPI00367FA2CA